MGPGTLWGCARARFLVVFYAQGKSEARKDLYTSTRVETPDGQSTLHAAFFSVLGLRRRRGRRGAGDTAQAAGGSTHRGAALPFPAFGCGRDGRRLVRRPGSGAFGYCPRCPRRRLFLLVARWFLYASGFGVLAAAA